MPSKASLVLVLNKISPSPWRKLVTCLTHSLSSLFQFRFQLELRTEDKFLANGNNRLGFGLGLNSFTPEEQFQDHVTRRAYP